ncbi:MAG: NAD-dependent dihydropyrimidine dehydrogenase subunit PreA [Myxococcales bacterium]|nr:NAD-dependent dihydropyrimidine dehydrogenase subunit PreA [Myxococcales bacterium]
MADLKVDFCGIESPNPFWLASAPPTNTGAQVERAFAAGWGGAVWKTLGNPIVNVSSRFGGLDYGSQRMMGLNNIELITDRPLEVNLREMAQVKRRYPKHVLVASLMVDTKAEWQEIIKKVEDVGCDALELNFGCPHGMCERGMGSAVGAEPKVLRELTSWVMECANVPVIVKLTPNVGDITEPASAAMEAGTSAISLINTVKSIMGVDLDRMVPLPRVGDASSNGGYCGPAVKPIALHLLGQVARLPNVVPISGIGGIATWRDAAEFMALGSTTVQVCTAVMHYGYRIVEDMIEGLSDFLDDRGMSSAMELVGRAVPNYRNWGDLDMNHHVVAEIDPERCIGCQLCFVSCMDGSHQCIHLPGMSEEEKRRRGHVVFPAEVPDRAALGEGAIAGARVPWVHAEECVGCNLCQLVCPVEGCISMRERRKGEARLSWNERIASGDDLVPGGLDATRAARAGRSEGGGE